MYGNVRAKARKIIGQQKRGRKLSKGSVRMTTVGRRNPDPGVRDIARFYLSFDVAERLIQMGTSPEITLNKHNWGGFRIEFEFAAGMPALFIHLPLPNFDPIHPRLRRESHARSQRFIVETRCQWVGLKPGIGPLALELLWTSPDAARQGLFLLFPDDAMSSEGPMTRDHARLLAALDNKKKR